MTQAAMNMKELNMNEMTMISGGELTELRKQHLLALIRLDKAFRCTKEHSLEWCRSMGIDPEEIDFIDKNW